MSHSLLDHDYFIWFVSTLLSISLFSAFFVLRNQNINAAPALVIQETITHVKFSTPAPPPVTIVEPEIKKPEPEPQKIEEVIPPEPIEEKPKPIAKPRPKPKKKKPLPKLKPVKKKPPLKKKNPLVKKKTLTQTFKPVAHKFAKPSPIVSKSDALLIEQTRISYQALLMRHIEVYKHYPRIARKRKIEGKILVSFTLLDGGKIKNLSINGKKSILKKATQQAIDNALPMPFAPKSISLPMKVKFYMNYFLR